MINASTSVCKSNDIASVPISLTHYCYYYAKNYNEAFYYHYMGTSNVQYYIMQIETDAIAVVFD